MRKEIDIRIAVFIIGAVVLAVVSISIFAGYMFLWNNYDTRSQAKKDIGQYKLMVSRERKDPNAHVDLGWGYYNEGKWGKAMAEYQEALEYDPGNVGAWYNLGLVYNELKNYQQSKECFKKVISLNNRHELAYFTLGQQCSRQGQYDDAIDYLTKASKLSRGSANICYELGLAYEGKGITSEAKLMYQKALSFVPDYQEAKERLLEVQSREDRTK